MNDVLAERFSALIDDESHADWHDVRRRARRSRLVPVVALVAAVVCAAAAVASVGGQWQILQRSGGAVHGVATLALPDGRWTVGIDLTPDTSVQVAKRGGTVVIGGDGGVTYTLRNPRGRVVMNGVGSSGFKIRRVGTTLTMVSHQLEFSVYAMRSRAIVFGVAHAGIARIRVLSGSSSTDVPTVATNVVLRARLWAAAVPGNAKQIRLLALASDGTVLARTRIDVRGPRPLRVSGTTYKTVR